MSHTPEQLAQAQALIGRRVRVGWTYYTLRRHRARIVRSLPGPLRRQLGRFYHRRLFFSEHHQEMEGVLTRLVLAPVIADQEPLVFLYLDGEITTVLDRSTTIEEIR